MHQQRRGAEEIAQARVGEELEAAAARDRLAEEEVAVAVHQADRDAAAGEPAERVEQAPVEAVVGVVVAEPPVEEVAEDVERRRRPRLLADEPKEPLRDRRRARARDADRRRRAPGSRPDAGQPTHLGALDDHVLDRHVLVHAAACRSSPS